MLTVQTAIILLRVNLPFERALVPTAFNRFPLIKRPGIRAVHAHQHPVRRPRGQRREALSQFRARWVAFFCRTQFRTHADEARELTPPRLSVSASLRLRFLSSRADEWQRR